MDIEVGDIRQQPENPQKPQHYDNNHHAIQERLYGSLHGKVIVDEPQKHADDHQDYDHG
jgi:hypothetical protein